jgi:hypothetical protein
MKVLVTSFFLCFSTFAFACSSELNKGTRDHSVLVAEATSIVIAKAVTVKNSNSCELKVVTTLKGTNTGTIVIPCRTSGYDGWKTDYSSHTEISFWQDRIGRLGINNDCIILPPALEAGQNYLLLLGITPDTKQFEKITSPTDKWLMFVKQKLFQAVQ